MLLCGQHFGELCENIIEAILRFIDAEYWKIILLSNNQFQVWNEIGNQFSLVFECLLQAILPMGQSLLIFRQYERDE